MKKICVFLIALFAFLGSNAAFSQDIYFSAIGSRNDGNAAPTTSGTLTAGSNPELEASLRNFASLTSFQYSYENLTTLNAGGGASSGRTQLNAITITKNIDQSSNRLMQAGLSNVRLSTAQILVIRPSGNGPQLFVCKIDLKNAYITEFNASAGAAGSCTNGCVGESFKIIYEAIQVTTYSQNPTTGVITANPPATWNQASNTATY